MVAHLLSTRLPQGSEPGGSDDAFRRVMQAFTVLYSERAAYDADRAAALAAAPAAESAAKRRKAEPAPNAPSKPKAQYEGALTVD